MRRWNPDLCRTPVRRESRCSSTAGTWPRRSPCRAVSAVAIRSWTGERKGGHTQGYFNLGALFGGSRKKKDAAWLVARVLPCRPRCERGTSRSGQCAGWGKGTTSLGPCRGIAIDTRLRATCLWAPERRVVGQVVGRFLEEGRPPADTSPGIRVSRHGGWYESCSHCSGLIFKRWVGQKCSFKSSY